MKKLIAKIVLFFLYRGFKVVYKIDEKVKSEIDSWNEGFGIKIITCKNGPSLYIKKENGNIVRVKNKEEKAEIEILFKNFDSAFLLLTGRMGISKAYAQHRFLLKGNIMDAMSFVRCTDIVESYLFPKFITKRILKEVTKRKVNIFIVYIRVIIGG